MAIGVMAAGVSGLALTATPALADPTEQLVAVGSDTIQDVYNQFSLDLGSNALGSYNAVNPVTAVAAENITPVDGTAGVNCSFSRPNGSTPGIDALESAIGGTVGAGSQSPLPGAGCVDIARSSAGPNTDGTPATGNYTGTNAIQFVPFALDAVTAAIGPATGGTVGGVTTVATSVPSVVGTLTIAQLTSLYACNTVTVGTTTLWPYGGPNGTSVPPGDTRIDLYIPQEGSGTEKFWAKTLSFTYNAPPGCVSPTIVNGADTGMSVEEHDGTAVATDTFGYGPFSIAQWVAQSNNIDDRRHGAVLQDINSIVPLCNGAMNTGQAACGSVAFPVTRDVYSVVSKARFDSATDPLHNLLFGTSSTVCQDKGTITHYGFALLGSACGEEIPALTASP
jgi:hypothetical protein